MKFSIITPFYLYDNFKEDQLRRCLASVDHQYCEEFSVEHILIDNGSNIDSSWIALGQNRVLIKTLRLERLIAFKKGLEESKGDWIVFCDSDDELLSTALLSMSQVIEANPDTKVFNFESVHMRRNYQTNIRGAFKPKVEVDGHEVFGGGNIVNGTFIFHKSLITKEMLDGLEFTNPWDFSIEFQKRFPEIKSYFTVDDPNHREGYPKELGNPWGNDYYFFYQITRNNVSKAYDFPVILIHHEGKKKGEQHQL